MFPSGSTYKEQIAELERALELPDYFSQDWGICHADASRVPEFVTFFETNYNETWLTPTIGEFMDLVFESACDALKADPSFRVSSIDKFVARTAPLAPERIAYWTMNDSEIEGDFAITPHLRGLGY